MMMKMNNKRLAYIAFLGHGMLLAITMSMIDFNTVFPAMVNNLSESKITFGALYSIMLGVPFIFNLLFSHMMRRARYKKKYLLIGIFLRASSFLGMAIFVALFSVQAPTIVIFSLFFWIFLFSVSGGFAGIAYLDIVGKVFNKDERGRMFTYKQLLSSIAALVGGLVIKGIFDFQAIDFPNNYALILTIAFTGLFLAGFLFILIKEPASDIQGEGQNLKDFIREIPVILRKDKNFFQFIVVQNLTSLSLMILPFYMVFAKENFQIDASFIGNYLLFQISGTILSNFFWGAISRKWGNRVVVRLCILLGAITPILAIIIGYKGPQAYSLIFFVVGFAISGRKIGFDPYLLEISPENNRTTYIGINGTFSLFIVISPLLGGTIIEFFGFTLTFIVVSVVMFFAAFVFKGNNVNG